MASPARRPLMRGQRRPARSEVEEEEEYEEPAAYDEEDEGPLGYAGKNEQEEQGPQGRPTKRGRLSASASQRQQQQGGGGGGGQRQGGVPAGELQQLHERLNEMQRTAGPEFYKGPLSRQEVDNLTRTVVRHAIFKNSEKPGTPFLRQELTALITQHAGGRQKGGLANHVIACAQHRLLQDFGLELAELAKLSGTGAACAHAFPTCSVTCRGQSECEARRGLLIVVLSILELSGGKAGEDELWDQLGHVGVQKGVDHPMFGDPAALLVEFAAERWAGAAALGLAGYIGLEKVPGPEGESRTYFLAENAAGAASELGEHGIQSFYEAEFEAAA
eukprot:scaffold14.g1102.t1